MQDRGPAENSPEDQAISAELPTLAAGTPPPTSQATVEARGSAREQNPAQRPRPKAVDDWTGREVAGRYTVLERLGEGGMGVVYVAEHLHLKKKVAFKVIHPQLAAHEDLLLRFKREALATGQLDHPHIAAAIDFGELEDGGAFMVMPWVRGHSLQTELERDGPIDFRRAAGLCAQIADALSAAHGMGIIHRDLKPDNVLVETRSDGSEAAKVLDFGVASLAGQPEGLSVDARPLTQAGTILGTPGYMSPEQASAGEVDHRTDLYALGVILWELCKGERLFEGTDVTAIFAKQFNSVPPPLELGRSAVARELSELVTRLLAWDKHQRPSSAAEVRDALRRIAEMPESRISSLRLGLEALPRLYRQRVPELYRRHAPQVLAGLAVVIAILIVLLGGKEQAPPLPTPAPASAPPATKGVKPGAIERGEARPQAAPTVAEPASHANAGASPPGPSSAQEDQDTVLRSRSREARRSAAKRVLRNTAGTPHYVKLVAELEAANGCPDKRAVIEEMRTLADPRVLPALERLAEQPKRGCGLLRLTDCLWCLRRDLDQTIGTLRGR
jgi:serine/threonine-protein kinase